MKTYVDGVLRFWNTTSSPQDLMSPLPTFFSIGSRNGGFEGIFDELRVSDIARFGDPSCTGTVYLYTPDTNFNGVDSFTFEANDGQDSSSEAVVSITVEPVNDAPLWKQGLTKPSMRTPPEFHAEPLMTRTQVIHTRSTGISATAKQLANTGADSHLW